MARGRMISKSLSTSRKFANAGSEFAQTLYMLIVSHADDFGRQSGDAFTVKHQVLPTSPRSEQEFESALVQLTEAGLVTRYNANGDLVLQVVNFEAHQVGLHKRSESRFPDNPGTSGKFPGNPIRREGKGTKENGTEGNSSAPLISGVSSPAGWAKVHNNHIPGFCDWVCLPDFIFAELCAKSGQGDGSAYVTTWAHKVRQDWQGKAIGDDGLKFWRARWADGHKAEPKAQRVSVAAMLARGQK